VAGKTSVGEDDLNEPPYNSKEMIVWEGGRNTTTKKSTKKGPGVEL